MSYRNYLRLILVAIGCVACRQTPQNDFASIAEPANSIASNAEAWNVKPGSVYDGDTLRVIRDGEELKIRFCGIDAPEKAQMGGIESRDYLRSLAPDGSEILITQIELDRYGRTVADLWTPDGTSLTEAMVAAGHAWHYEKYSGDCSNPQQLAIAEEDAREKGLGLWSDDPIPPWEWRRLN